MVQERCPCTQRSRWRSCSPASSPSWLIWKPHRHAVTMLPCRAMPLPQPLTLPPFCNSMFRYNSLTHNDNYWLLVSFMKCILQLRRSDSTPACAPSGDLVPAWCASLAHCKLGSIVGSTVESHNGHSYCNLCSNVDKDVVTGRHTSTCFAAVQLVHLPLYACCQASKSRTTFQRVVHAIR